MKIKGLTIILTLVACLVAVSVCPAAQKGSDGSLILKFGTGVPAGSMSATQVEKFGALVTEKTGGKIKFKYFHDSQLGQEPQLAEAAGLGTIDVVMTDAAYVANLNPAFGVLDYMYVYRDLDGYRNVLASGIFDELSAEVARRSGIIPLAPFVLGPRHLITMGKMIKQPVDAQGLLLRSSPSELSQYFTLTLGGSPTPIPWPETYMAMKQGMVVGAECSIECIWYGKWHEVCDTLILTGHVFTNEVVSISKMTWQRLTADQQAAVKEAAMEVAAWKVDQVDPSTRSFFKKMMAANAKLQVVELTPEQKLAFKERAIGYTKEFRKKHAKYNWGGFYDRVVKLGWE